MSDNIQHVPNDFENSSIGTKFHGLCLKIILLTIVVEMFIRAVLCEIFLSTNVLFDNSIMGRHSIFGKEEIPIHS